MSDTSGKFVIYQQINLNYLQNKTPRLYHIRRTCVERGKDAMSYFARSSSYSNTFLVSAFTISQKVRAIHWAISSLPLPRFAITWDLKSKLYLTSGLSTLPDNPRDSRFWTVSPALQIRVWNLLDNRRSLPFPVDSTFWQWNFKYFALVELFYCTSKVFSQTPVCHCNMGNNVIGGK